jgi:leader peptidase (prepilin peptidase)/N-methyltransferase
MDFLLNQFMTVYWLLCVFVLGTFVGSALNVCVARLPQEKSILWPLGSRCGHCLQPIRWYDNLPLLSYWLLRGRCRMCKAPFSMRYFWVELLTGVLFMGLFYLEVIDNVHDLPFFKKAGFALRWGTIPWQGWAFFAHHAILLSVLIATSFCDLERREIPFVLPAFGLVVGLIGSAFFPWPWPNDLAVVQQIPAGRAWWLLNPDDVPRGLYPWPFWGPPPDWAPAGSWQLGLLTGVTGALVGTFMLRGVRSLFTRGLGQEALGMGDADLMMMVGSFLGWQPVVIAFFAGAVVSLVFAIVQLVVNRDHALPFGPGLAVGSLVTWLGWRWVAPQVQPLFFNEWLLGILAGLGGAFMLVASAFFRLIRRREPSEVPS